MKTPVIFFSAVVGAVFLAIAYIFYYQPDFMNDYTLDEIRTNSHSKARAAVSRLLFDPASAQFGLLRSVWVGKTKYVCGGVSAKDRSGAVADYRALVYTAAIDLARIDDDEVIAQRHDAFKPCPLSEEEELAQQRTAISPGALSVLKTMQKAIPTADPSISSTVAPQVSSAGGKSSGATTEQLLGQLAGQAGSEGQRSSSTFKAPLGNEQPAGRGGSQEQQSSSAFKAALGNEGEWRSDRPPAAWPVLPPDHALSKPVKKRTTAQAIALAAEIEERWAQFKAGNPQERPSPDDIREALGALLAIDPKDAGFPRAWAAFVRLRKIERDAGA
jgi:hypothetical protein